MAPFPCMVAAKGYLPDNLQARARGVAPHTEVLRLQIVVASNVFSHVFEPPDTLGRRRPGDPEQSRAIRKCEGATLFSIAYYGSNFTADLREVDRLITGAETALGIPAGTLAGLEAHVHGFCHTYPAVVEIARSLVGQQIEIECEPSTSLRRLSEGGPGSDCLGTPPYKSVITLAPMFGAKLPP